MTKIEFFDFWTTFCRDKNIPKIEKSVLQMQLIDLGFIGRKLSIEEYEGYRNLIHLLENKGHIPKNYDFKYARARLN